MSNIFIAFAYIKLRFFYKFLPFLYYPIISLLTKIAFSLLKKRQKIAQANLDYIYQDTISQKEKKDIILKSFQNYIYALRHFIENKNISKEKLAKKIIWHNKEIAENAYKENKKVIFVTGHFGNWELLVLSITAFITNNGAGIAQYTKSNFINKIMHQTREQFGGLVLDREDGLINLLKILKTKTSAVLFLDQKVLKKGGTKVNFLGKPTYYTNTASLIARKYNFIIIPIYINTNDNKTHHITLNDAIYPDLDKTKDEDFKLSCQKQAEALEDNIKLSPHLWHWMHKKWEYDVDGLYD